ncbi:copper chaperone PCu(A)C [Massilia sp. 9I]|uniref:copper chaperone PCu(A)C n=1 Tax=Massilia sp. 9I TaxID=2653152 RepID=UPI0012EEE3AF|nr:copper chaperone PCu(A)C [Massilia sp. 9I]VXB01265.1 Copper metallochaperone, bacterial analog of Cox17 protein [Massilia sp. 9I]
MKPQILALFAGSLLSASVFAQVSVSDPWIRATVPAQKVTGAFMRVQSATPARLLGVQTEVAGRAELHEMAMEGQTMRMRGVESIELPAGKPVNLASGGYHVMLMDLKRQVKEGENVDLTLQVQDAAGKRQDVKLSVPVKPLTYSAHSGH